MKIHVLYQILSAIKKTRKSICPKTFCKKKFYSKKHEQINAKKIIAQKIKNNEKIKLHLGCGTVYKEGWINIDNNSDNNIEKLDINWDLRWPLPFDDNSVDFIYNEHFLEHLTVEEGREAIKRFMKVLKPGGVMRISMPDLVFCVNMYTDDNWKETNKEFLEKFGLSGVQTKAEMLNINFRSWGHKWLYDWAELERRLKEAGCDDIKRGNIKESDYPELRDLETRNESTLIAEVKKK